MSPLFVFTCGCFFFPLCFHFMNTLLKKIFSQSLSQSKILNMSIKCMSSIQASMSCCVGYTIARNCPRIMSDRHWLSNAYAWFAFPYFYYDLWAMYKFHCLTNPYLFKKSVWNSVVHFMKHNSMMAVHHGVLPVIFLPTILVFRGGCGDFFVGVFYMIEIAVPFIGLWNVLVSLQISNQLCTMVAGIAMIIVFALSRVFVFPFLYWCYSTDQGINFWKVAGHIPIKCNIGCMILLLPQLYWLVLMMKGAYKVLGKKQSMSVLARGATVITCD